MIFEEIYGIVFVVGVVLISFATLSIIVGVYLKCKEKEDERV